MGTRVVGGGGASADWLEERLLSELQAAVVQPDAVEYAIGEFQRQLTASMADLSTKLGRTRERAEQIQAELRNLISLAARADTRRLSLRASTSANKN